jgi:formate hydrogenlyase transcriptional activator
LRAPLSELRDDAPASGNSLLEDVERDHILRILRESDGVISTAANRLGIPRTTLDAVMKKPGVSRRDL